MRLHNRDIRHFLAHGWSQYAVIVFFGHAEDVMRHYQDSLIQQAGIDTSDAFSFARFTGAQISENPEQLLNEAFSSSLMMQPRTICAWGKSSDLHKTITALCQPESQNRLGDNRVWMVVEDVRSKSALLKQLDQCHWAAAVPCYEANDQQLKTGIDSFCQQHGLKLDKQAKNLLLDGSHHNWNALKHTLSKLRLYGKTGNIITADDVIACSDDAHQHSLMNFAVQAFAGRADVTDQQLRRLLAQKVTEIALIRQLMQHCLKLLRLQGHAEKVGIDAAIAAYQPAIFFKQVNAITQQCQHFRPQQLQEYMGQLLDLEIRFKSQNSDAQAMLRQWLLRLAQPSAKSA